MRTPQLLAIVLVIGIAATACRDDAPNPVEPESALMHVHPGTQAAASGDIAVSGGVILEPLARGAFPHEIDAMFKFRYDRGIQVVHVRDLSDVIVARLTIEAGGSAGWHRHPGSALINVISGTFGIIEETDCVLRTYTAGQVAFHRGQNIVDVGFNAGEGEVQALVTFLGVPAGDEATIPVPPEEAPC